jgi:hypothetical protein
VTVTFKPTVVGAMSATLVVTSNDSNEPTVNVALTGTGVAPEINVTPTSRAFGNVLVGATSPAQTVTIQNIGTSALSLTNIVLGGTNPGQFARSGGTCATTFPANLAAGASCTVLVTFKPTTVGAKSATLVISSNDSNEPTVNVALTGTGVAPDLAMCWSAPLRRRRP